MGHPDVCGAWATRHPGGCGEWATRGVKLLRDENLFPRLVESLSDLMWVRNMPKPQFSADSTMAKSGLMPLN